MVDIIGIITRQIDVSMYVCMYVCIYMIIHVCIYLSRRPAASLEQSRHVQKILYMCNDWFIGLATMYCNNPQLNQLGFHFFGYIKCQALGFFRSANVLGWLGLALLRSAISSSGLGSLAAKFPTRSLSVSGIIALGDSKSPKTWACFA